MLEAKEHARYIREYIAVYRAHANDPLERELACLQVQIPHALEDLTKDCFYAGAHRTLAIGFAPQEASGFAYFFNEGAFAELLGALGLDEKQWDAMRTSEEFAKTCARAGARIEIYNIQRLDSSAANGAKFHLERKFGWDEKAGGTTETEIELPEEIAQWRR